MLGWVVNARQRARRTPPYPSHEEPSTFSAFSLSLSFHESPVTNHESLSSLECALTSKHRVLSGFGRSCPPASPLGCALTQTASVTHLECALTKRGGGTYASLFLLSCNERLLQICALVFNHFQDAPPANLFLSSFCIVAPGGMAPIGSHVLFNIEVCIGASHGAAREDSYLPRVTSHESRVTLLG
jgi:hypothetical protein